MNSIIESLNLWGGKFVEFAGMMLWQSGLLIVILFALDFLFRRKIRASIRYALWLVVLLKLILPPALALPTSPAWWLRATPATIQIEPQIQNYTVTYDSDALSEMPQNWQTVAPQKISLTLSAWLLLLSVSVSAILFLWLIVRWWQIARQARRAQICERLTDLSRETQSLAGLKFKSNPPVKLTANLMSPAVCGLFRPVILMPQTLADKFSDDQLRAVLLHELIHLRRRDVWLNFAQSLLQIVYWWQPLLWLANARIRRAREEAVDDAVMLALRDGADNYAPTLLEVAKLAFQRPLMSLGLVGIMESRSALRQRIERLVNFRAPRRAGLTLVSALGICAFTAVAVPMGEAPNSPNSSDKKNSSVIEKTISTTTSPAINLQPVLIEGSFYRIGEADFENAVAGLKFNQGEKNGNSWWLASSEELVKFQDGLAQSNLKPFQRPRIQTFSGKSAQIFIGNDTNGIEFDCTPIISNDGRVNLMIQGEITVNGQNVILTNQFRAQTILENRGGVVFYVKNAGAVGNNVMVVAQVTANTMRTFTGTPADIEIRTYGTNGFHAVTKIVSTTPTNLPDNSSISDDRTNALPQLFTRSFKINKDKFYGALKDTGLSMDNSTNVASAARAFFGKEGVDLDWPEGKALFYNDRNGVLVVRATESDLDRIEKIAIALNQSAEQNTGTLTDSNFVAALHQLQQHARATNLSEPEPIVRTQIRGENHLDSSVRSGLLQNLKNAQTNSISGRQKIIEKLNHIRLNQVHFENASLSEVARQLAVSSKENDPEHKGVNFLINPDPNLPGPPTIDPVTGLPIINSTPAIDLATTATVSMNLTNVSLAEVLDGIVVTAELPPGHSLKYSIQDFGVVFGDYGDVSQLFTRRFKLDGKRFADVLRDQTGLPIDKIDNSENIAHTNWSQQISRAALALFSKAGVDWWESPKGKAVFYDERNGKLIVRATKEDLDTVELMLQGMMDFDPQVHIKARFIEAPKGTLARLKFDKIATTNQEIVGIMTTENFKAALRDLEPHSENLAEPEVVTTSGRQTQMRATTVITVITNFAFQESYTNISTNGTLQARNAVLPQVAQLETGPVFDTTPRALDDNCTISLSAIASRLEFIGYATVPSNAVPQSVTNSDNQVIQLPIVWPMAQVSRAAAHVNLYDGQTLVLGGFQPEQIRFGKPDAQREKMIADEIRSDEKKHHADETELLVFATVTMVDPAGNPIHLHGQLPFAQTKIPPQPTF